MNNLFLVYYFPLKHLMHISINRHPQILIFLLFCFEKYFRAELFCHHWLRTRHLGLHEKSRHFNKDFLWKISSHFLETILLFSYFAIRAVYIPTRIYTFLTRNSSMMRIKCELENLNFHLLDLLRSKNLLHQILGSTNI